MKQTAVKQLKKTFTSGAFFAPLVVFCLYFLQLAVTGVYPFNRAYSVASYDLSAQICPFIEHLFDVLDGKSSLFYSTAIAGGMDVFGTFAYFFVSPFSFLFLLFGDGNVVYAAWLVMACKLAVIAFVGAFTAQKLFKNIPSALCGVCGIVYAYCGYTFVANTYIGWMDFLIYAPLAVCAFIKMTKTGRFLPFSACLSAFVYTCFSLGCFSFLTVYPVLVCYGLICVEKEGRKRFVATLSLSFFVAIALSLPLLYPALYAYIRSARGVGLFENVWKEFTQSGFDKGAFWDIAATAWFRKFSYIFSDSAFLCLTAFWFFKTRLKTPLSRFMLVAGVYLFIPVLSDESMNLLNMGSYMSYALRFGFLNASYLFFGALLGLNALFEKRESVPLVEKKSPSRLFLAVWAVCFLAMLVFILSGGYISVWEHILKDPDMISDTKNFSGIFAHSLGGLQVIGVLFVLVALCFSVAGVCLKHGGNLRMVSMLLVALVGVQVVFYNEQLVLGNRSLHRDGASYQTLLSGVELGDYRVKDYGDFLTANEPFTSGSNSFSVFSSMADEDNFSAYRLFGYKESSYSKNVIKSAGGNRFGDALLGYKYYFVPESRKESVDALTYLSATQKDGKVLTAGGFYLYENKAVFPLGFTVPTGNFTLPYPNETENNRKNQFALYEYLWGAPQGDERSVTTRMTYELSLELSNRAADVRLSAGKIEASVTAKDGEYLFLPFVASKGYRAFVNGEEKPLSQNDLHFLCVELDEGENEVVFSYRSPYPKKILFGAFVGGALLVCAWFVLKKTTLFEKSERALYIASIALSALITAFFFLFPTGVFLFKIIRLLI